MFNPAKLALPGTFRAMKFSDLSLSKKINLVLASAMLVLFVSLALSISSTLLNTFETRTEAELDNTTAMITDMINVYNSSLKRSTDRMVNVLHSLYPEGFQLANNENGQATLFSNGVDVANNHNRVDHFANITGAAATIFVRRNDSFVRISTSIHNEQGSRVLGTELDRTHPAYAAAMNKQKFIGKAQLFGKDYVTQYAPILNSNGEVIGISFIGVEFTEGLKALKDELRNIKIGKTGYAYILDVSKANLGQLVLHPSNENQNILDYKDHNGSLFIQKMIEQKQGKLIYRVANDDAEKLASFSTYDEWQWLIVVMSTRDELMEANYQIILSLLIILSIFFMVLIGAVFAASNIWITRPLERAKLYLKQLAAGDLRTQIISPNRDEVGQLLYNMEKMRNKLATLMKDISQNANQLAQAADEMLNNAMEVAKGTDEQSGAASDMAASMEQMTTSIASVSVSSKEILNNAQHGQDQTVTTGKFGQKCRWCCPRN